MMQSSIFPAEDRSDTVAATAELKTSARHLPWLDKLLLATDLLPGGSASFEMAVTLTATFTSTLEILHVLALNGSSDEGAAMPADIGTTLARAQDGVDRMCRDGVRLGVPCQASAIFGSPAASILEAQKLLDIQLIVLGVHAPKSLARLSFGSTAEAVIRQAHCPVLTVREQSSAIRDERRNEPGVVVFATDFHPSTTNAVRYASALSQAFGLPLHCLHVLPRTMAGRQVKVIPSILTDALKHMTEHEEVQPATCAIEYGSEVSATVLEYARRHHAAFLVLGVRQSSMVATHLPTHIAFRILMEAPCPVLTMAYAYEAPHSLMT